MHVALQSLADIPAAALQGNAFEPPLYFWLLHGVLSLFGTSEAGLRALSVAAGVITVPVTWLLVRDLTDRPGTATVVAFLLAANPLHLWFSQEARPYSLMLLFGVAALLCLRLAVRTGRPMPWVAYAVLSALTILCHATGIVVPATAAFWVTLTERRWKTISRFGAASLVTVLLITPFLYTLAATIEPGSTGSPPRALTGLEGPYSLFTYVAGHSFGPSVREIQNNGWRVAIERNAVQTAVVVAILGAILALALRARSEAIWLLGILVAVPIGAAMLGSAITTKAYSVRYTLPALVGFLGVAGVVATGLTARARRVYLGVLLLVSLWADAQWFFVPRYWKEDSRSAVACLTERVEPGSTVAVIPGYMRSMLDHYARLAGTPLSIVAVSVAGDVEKTRPAALLTTRLHHASEALELVREFRETTDGSVVEGQVPGYQIYLRSRTDRLEPRLTCEVLH